MAKARCAPGGELLLEGVEVEAWQSFDLPRNEDDVGRRRERQPDRQLAAMFRRVRASLNAWIETVDHLC